MPRKFASVPKWNICYTYAATGPKTYVYYFNINYR